MSRPPPFVRVLVWLGFPVALAAVASLARSGHTNATTAGFLYLLVVLAVSTWGGAIAGLVAAAAALICLNYFYLPPFGTLAIADPANWVALVCFLGSSALVSRLVASARAGASAAEERRRDVQALYDLCLGLFSARPGPEAAAEATGLTLAALQASGGALLPGDDVDGEDAPQVAAAVQLAGDAEVAPEPAAAVRATHRAQVGPDGETLYLPLEVGGHLNGVLAYRGGGASPAVREAAARLLALAIERERLHAERAGLAAVRASEALLTSLLRAVSHDLRTPLTAMRLEIESLGRRLAGDAALAESLDSLGREQERLARRIDNLLSTARLESGLARPHPEPVEPAELFRLGRDSIAGVLAGRRVLVHVEPDCPPLWIDPSLALEILVNLLENAARATPAEEPLELVAAPGAAGQVRLEVRDRGAGVPAGLQQLLWSRPVPGAPDWAHADPRSRAGDTTTGGLGLRIARSFAEASGGTLALVPRADGGTVARLEVPAAAAGELAG